MVQGLLPRVQELESELGNLRSKCSSLESECQGLREQVRHLDEARQASDRAQLELANELRAQVAALVGQLQLGGGPIEASAAKTAPNGQAGKAKVGFRDRNSVVDIPAASDARPVKKRVPTTFAPAVAQSGGLRFADDEDVEEVEAETGTLGEAKLRPTKSRQATCFAPAPRQMDEEEDEEESGTAKRRVAFNNQDSTVEVEGASEARSAKKRVPTTFAKSGASSAGGGVSFDDDIDEEEVSLDSGSASTGKVTEAKLRPTKSRQATCFAPRQAVEEEDEDDEEEGEGEVAQEAAEDSSPKKGKKGVAFRQHASIVEIAGSGGPARPVKKRQATAFVPQEESAGSANGVSFAEAKDAEVIEAEGGQEAPEKLRPTKSRQATCFAPKPAPDDDEDESPTQRRRVGFQSQDSVVEVEASGEARSAKKRAPTAFAFASAGPAAQQGGGVHFADADDVEEEVCEESAKLRPAKSRQATCFAPKSAVPVEDEEEASPSGRRRVGFRKQDSVVEVEARGEVRSAKKRSPTAFAPAGAAEQGGGVHFADAADVEEEVCEESAKLRPAKSRQATCFAPKSAAPEEEEEAEQEAAGEKSPGQRRRVGFQQQDSVVEVEARGESRSAKKRSPTAFAPAGAAAQQGGGVHFADADDVEEEVREESAKLRPAKSRQATCFAPKSAAPEEEEEEEEEDEAREPGGRVRFRSKDNIEEEQEVDDDSEEEIEIEEGSSLRPSRVRQATSFAPPPQDDDEEDEDEDEDEAQGRSREVSFNENIVELNGSGDTTGSVRSSRKRVPTTFVHKKSLSQVSFGSVDTEMDEEDRQSEGRRATRTRLPTTFARAKAIDYTESIADEDTENLDMGEQEGDGDQTGESEVKPSEGAAEDTADIMRHHVPGAPKDVELIKTSLGSLYFFSDLDEAGREALVAVMEVFDFADGEKITLQGNAKGTHFFIVAEGTLDVVRDDVVQAQITKGAAFGESVVLLSGAQNATVRSCGPVRVFGATGHEIRRTLRNRYHKEHKDAYKQISDLLSTGSCTLLHKLSPYQKQLLYDKARLSSSVCGDYLMREGEAVNAIHVHIHGRFSLSVAGTKLQPPEKFGMIGEMGLLNRHADATVMAEEPAQTIALTREVLNDMFGEKLQEELLQSYFLARLAQHHLFTGLGCEQLGVIASLSEIVELPPGGTLQEGSAYFIMAIDGAVEAEAVLPGSDATPQKQQLVGVTGDAIGEDTLCEQNTPWSLRVSVASSSRGPARIAIWKTSGLGEIVKHKSRLDAASPSSRASFKKMGSIRMAMWQDDKETALQKVVVLRTLSTQQLQRLAESLEVLHVEAGTVVFSQGEAGNDFYIIHSGQLSVKIDGRHVRTLGMGDYVGERALLFSDPRSATIEVAEDAELWKMNKESFMDVVKGPILDYMKDRIAFQNTRVEIDSLICLRIVGRGGFGVVKMVQSPATRTRYALKCVNKREAVAQKQQKSLAVERSILAELDHPFVIKFVRSFLGKHYVYFLMELVTGGELLDALDKLGLLKRPQAQFYVGSLALALEFLHERRIAYLDIKGENCLIDQHGYIKIIDFGIAERLSGGRIYAVKGTPLFMAPEVILGKGYTCSADLWSLGVCMFDFIAGRFPFGNDKSTNPQIFRAILKSPLKFTKQIEKDQEAKSFLEGLLTRDPQKRLGAGPEGYEEIKRHPFFEGFSWDGVLSRQLDPPFIPTCETYAEDQDEASPAPSMATTNPRMTGIGGAVEGETEEGDDDWVDPDPSWQEHF